MEGCNQQDEMWEWVRYCQTKNNSVVDCQGKLRQTELGLIDRVGIAKGNGEEGIAEGDWATGKWRLR